MGDGATGRIDHSQKRTEVTSIGRAETAREASSGRGFGGDSLSIYILEGFLSFT